MGVRWVYQNVFITFFYYMYVQNNNNNSKLNDNNNSNDNNKNCAHFEHIVNTVYICDFTAKKKKEGTMVY